ncbi:MFS transporter [Halomarina halobia]|uniref:MFS transporter n=1 Tax=Halomarina halobia TaxID=3033386 RepID=A0ABD6ADM4_9EURY|nr:MFS transporter [Halomarina sp. PSR21]
MPSLTTLFGDDAAIVDDRGFRLLLLANLSPPLGTALVSPLLDALTSPYAVSEARIGLMITAFTAPSIVLIPLVGALSDRVGRKPVLLVGLLLFGVGGTGLAFTADFRAVLALRFLQGIGFAGLTPVIVTSLGDLYEAGEEATAQGIRFATSGLTLMVFPLLAGVLVSVAWNVPFLLYALPFPVAVLVWRYFEEPSSPGRGRTSERGQTRALLRLVSQPRIAAVLVGRSVPNFLYIAFLTYNSFIVVRAVDGSPEQAGILVAVTSIVHASAATQAGRITALFESRLWPLVGATLSMGVGLAVIGLAPALPVALVGGVGVGAGFGVSLSLYRSVITGFTASLRGGLVSVGASLGRIAATVAPLVMGIAVANLAGALGFVAAVRWTVAATGLLCAAVGVACLAVARASPPVYADSVTGRVRDA